MSLPAIFSETLAYKQYTLDVLEKLKKFKKNYDNIPKNKIRQNYDYYWEMAIAKDEEINDAQDELNNCIHQFTECKIILKNMYAIIQQIKLTLNRGQIGTLEGRSRQVITDSGINPDPENVLQAAVLDQQYDELNEPTGGGKGVSKKRKNRVNNKTNRKGIKYVVKRDKRRNMHSK
jgi:hypothetical protein